MKTTNDRLNDAMTASEQGNFWATEFIRMWLDKKDDVAPEELRDKLRRYIERNYEAVLVVELGGDRETFFMGWLTDGSASMTDDIDQSKLFTNEHDAVMAQREFAQHTKIMPTLRRI